MKGSLKGTGSSMVIFALVITLLGSIHKSNQLQAELDATPSCYQRGYEFVSSSLDVKTKNLLIICK